MEDFDLGYLLASSMFEKMSKEQLLELKKSLENDTQTCTGGELQAAQDFLNDLNKYMEEKY